MSRAVWSAQGFLIGVLIGVLLGATSVGMVIR
jgi:gas vesicle protein